MTHSRLSLALEGTETLVASGRFLVVGPRASTDLAPLRKDGSVVVQGFRPDHDAFAAQGYEVVPEIADARGPFDAGIVFLPRSRIEGRAMIAEIAARVVPGGPVWVDGQKTDGVDSMTKDVRRHVEVEAPIAKAHGRIFRFGAADAFDDWRAGDLEPVPSFVTRPGVFSADKVDPGSRLLASALPERLDGRGADLGAGWGWLSAQVLARDGVTELHLVEADHAALSCARRNVTDPRARFHWADATRFVPGERFDWVVTNPPFHTTRAADPSLGAAFITAAAGMLRPAGTLLMVANRHLPYEAVLSQRFRHVEEIGGDRGFKLLRATQPVDPARPRR